MKYVIYELLKIVIIVVFCNVHSQRFFENQIIELSVTIMFMILLVIIYGEQRKNIEIKDEI